MGRGKRFHRKKAKPPSAHGSGLFFASDDAIVFLAKVAASSRHICCEASNPSCIARGHNWTRGGIMPHL